MTQSKSHLAVTGASMDKLVMRRPGRYLPAVIAVAATLSLLAWLAWQWMPRGLQVPRQDVKLGVVERSIFRDDIIVRGQVLPLNSVILDSVESGRVEEVLVRDGDMVKQGDLLFRLSNPQRRLDLLARQSDHATQISNLSNLQAGFEASRTDHQRRLSDLQYTLVQAEKQYARNQHLADQGFISSAVLEESEDKVVQLKRSVAEERSDGETAKRIKDSATRQMELAIRGLETGLSLFSANVDALAVRAPVAGRLTDFHLQIGETVKTDQHIGRIDSPDQFKLKAQIDEFYLNRIAVGHAGTTSINNSNYPVTINAVYPQINDGRFFSELVFQKTVPAGINPGLSLDIQLSLGDPTAALILPSGQFVNDSGGTWVFVLAADGKTALRRPVRLGRRSYNMIEVLSGLSAGEKVIISGYSAYGKAERLQLNN